MTGPAAPTFRAFLWRACATHLLTYFACGLLALTLLDYRHLYADTELRHLMRPTTSPWVAAGPALQVVRGTLFAVVLWPLADVLIARSWTILWGLLVGLAILGTAGPSPGSLEGAVFTSLPAWLHLAGLPEVLLQTAAFSFLLVSWCRRPARWMNIAATVGVALVLVMSLLGVVMAPGAGAARAPSPEVRAHGTPAASTLANRVAYASGARASRSPASAARLAMP